jgi:hypothetical protein
LLRYTSYGVVFRFRNANSNPVFQYGPALPVPLVHYPSARRIERYRSVRVTNLLPNIDSTFEISGSGGLTWSLSRTQSPCDWSAVVADVPVAGHLAVNSDTLTISLASGRMPPRILLAAPSAGAYRILGPKSFGFNLESANALTIPLTPRFSSPFDTF